MNFEFGTKDTDEEVVTVIPINENDGLNFQAVLRKILAHAEDPQRPTFLDAERQEFINLLLSHSNPLSKFIMHVSQFEGLTNEVEEVASCDPSEGTRFLALEVRAEFVVREKESDTIPDFVNEMFSNVDGH